jgi:predicted small secreted protein
VRINNEVGNMKSSQAFRHSAARLLLLAILLSGAAMGLSACNTTAGVGQDVSATGRALTNSADSAKQGL